MSASRMSVSCVTSAEAQAQAPLGIGGRLTSWAATMAEMNLLRRTNSPTQHRVPSPFRARQRGGSPARSDYKAKRDAHFNAQMQNRESVGVESATMMSPLSSSQVESEVAAPDANESVFKPYHDLVDEMGDQWNDDDGTRRGQPSTVFRVQQLAWWVFAVNIIPGWVRCLGTGTTIIRLALISSLTVLENMWKWTWGVASGSL
eukprot:SAG11_NODE_1293_length_5284_cov_2.541562_7_plen_203_part_00